MLFVDHILATDETHGLPMGGSLSTILVNIYLDHFESSPIPNFNKDTNPTIYIRYILTTFYCLPFHAPIRQTFFNNYPLLPK
jgi:hypothetical protein